MPKKDLIRRIDHIDERDKVQIPQAGDHVHAETEYGMSPNVGRSRKYARMDHTHGTPEERLWHGAMGGMSQVVGNLYGDLVTNSVSVAVTNLTASAFAFTTIKAACYPVAPTGDLVLQLSDGASTFSLTIAAGATASAKSTVAGNWAADADLQITITAVTGTYTGTVCVMLAA